MKDECVVLVNCLLFKQCRFMYELNGLTVYGIFGMKFSTL
jgi:hypothetical protein